MFEKRLGERFYSFDHKGWHFIILDAIGRGSDGHYIGQVDEEQIAWLKEDLNQVNPSSPIAVSVNIPFITGGAVCGRWWRNRPDTPIQEGFLVLRLQGEEVRREYVDYGWTTPYEQEEDL